MSSEKGAQLVGSPSRPGQHAVGIQAGKCHQVEAGLGIAVVQVARYEKSMTLRTHITYLENQILPELLLKGQVVLLGVLGAKVRQELSVKKNRPER